MMTVSCFLSGKTSWKKRSSLSVSLSSIYPFFRIRASPAARICDLYSMRPLLENSLLRMSAAGAGRFSGQEMKKEP